jgi:hypothetical protein
MTAWKPQKRKQTARELAKRFGKSPRQIRRVMAQPRAEYLAAQAARRAEAARLRAEGLEWAEVARRVGTSSPAAARMLALRARRERGDSTMLLRVTPQEKQLIETERAKHAEMCRG